MDEAMLKSAMAMAEKRQHVWIATTNEKGIPHLASVGSFSALPDGRVVLADWYCPETLANLQQNAHVAIVAWDVVSDTGYQLLGEVEEIAEWNVLDEEHGDWEYPWPHSLIERELYIRIEQVLAFSHAPHSDLANEEATGAVGRVSQEALLHSTSQL